ncbi:peritrophin-44 isoform X2 [Zeugodacus cucurbitae]|nr:peritrophin-44 isoform X2 [Zeugodacus cucurbitae]
MTAHLLILLLVGLTSSIPTDICRLFPDKTIIADPSSCNQYITCNNSVSQYTACPTSTPYFDNSTMKCAKTLSNLSHCTLSCSEHVNQFISDKTSCNGYYFCKNETTLLHGKCPNNLHFNSETQSCIYQSQSNCEINSFDICSVVKADTKIANENDCGKYFICDKKKGLTAKDCADGKFYNSTSGSEVEKWKVNCRKIPLPKEVCGTTKNPKRNKYVSDKSTCRGYFYCADKGSKIPDPAPVWGQCENGTFFDDQKQSCEDPLKTKCPKNADRCDGRSLAFVSGSRSGCRQYLRCKNGKAVEQKSCGNYFFDEFSAVCVSTPITYGFCLA